MGIFGHHGGGGQVRGQALVADINTYLDQTNRPFTLQATLVVEIPGASKFTVEHRERVGSNSPVLLKWPDQGDTVPVVADPADQSRVEVVWDEIRTHAEILNDTVLPQRAALKQQLLAQAYGQPPPTGAAPAEHYAPDDPGSDAEVLRELGEDAPPSS
jgi:hypothetical protein